MAKLAGGALEISDTNLMLAGGAVLAFLYLFPKQAGAAAVNLGVGAGTAAVQTSFGFLEGAGTASFEAGKEAGLATHDVIFKPVIHAFQDFERENQIAIRQKEAEFVGYKAVDLTIPLQSQPVAVWDTFRLGWNISPLGGLVALR